MKFSSNKLHKITTKYSKPTLFPENFKLNVVIVSSTQGPAKMFAIRFTKQSFNFEILRETLIEQESSIKINPACVRLFVIQHTC